jgi:predicted branched-subunit amino acid permease
LTREDRAELAHGARASLPFLLGVAPFGLVTGVAMAAGGLSPLAAMAMSIVVYAGASMLAATQLLAADTPIAVIVLTALFINLRFMMYSASLRQHFGGLPLRARVAAAYLTADNAYGASIARFNDQPAMPGKLGFYLGAGFSVWLVWQVTVALGIVLGTGLPAYLRLEFAAPLAFVALTIPLLRSRAMVAAAVASAIIVVLAAGLPLRLGLAAAALAGIAVGLVTERKGK